VGDADAEDERLASLRIAGEPLPFVNDKSGSDVITGHESVNGITFSGAVPGNGREISIVVTAVVFEWGEELQVKRVPEAEFDGWGPIGPIIEVGKDGLAIGALWCSGEAQQDLWPNGLHEGVEAVCGKTVALVNDDCVPVVRAKLVHERAGADTVDYC
jgi:hypothetical protein